MRPSDVTKLTQNLKVASVAFKVLKGAKNEPKVKVDRVNQKFKDTMSQLGFRIQTGEDLQQVFKRKIFTSSRALNEGTRDSIKDIIIQNWELVNKPKLFVV